ncbi:MAG TPA: class I SAM-dependent methyltransferase [Gaiellaceae bacterium]|nr:class I SAM-dependent methyltransferase [Gaiellaceae bacterium]
MSPGRHTGPVVDAVQGVEVVDCETCGFKHVVPVPSPAELEHVYREEYFSREKPLYIERHLEDADWWRLAYGDRYETFEELLPPDRRRILDVGSGPGLFLRTGAERGWRTLGVEPSRQAATHSRSLGLEIVEDFLDETTAATLGRHDVVHLSEVLEHIPDPEALLRLVHGLLDPGGLVCVVAPNDYSPFQRALRDVDGYDPWWLAPPHHVNYFDFESLARLLERCGFEVCLREATFPIDLFLLMGDRYVGDDEVGRACHARRKRFEHVLDEAGLTPLRRTLYRALAEHGIGREAIVVARLP